MTRFVLMLLVTLTVLVGATGVVPECRYRPFLAGPRVERGM